MIDNHARPCTIPSNKGFRAALIARFKIVCLSKDALIHELDKHNNVPKQLHFDSLFNDKFLVGDTWYTRVSFYILVKSIVQLAKAKTTCAKSDV